MTLPTSPEVEHNRAQTLGLSSCPEDADGNECELCAEQVDRLREAQHLATLQSLVAPEELEAGLEATYTDEACVRIERDLEQQGAGPATIENHAEACVRAAAPVLTAKLHQEVEKWKSAAMDELERRRTLGAEVTRLREALKGLLCRADEPKGTGKWGPCNCWINSQLEG